MPAGMGVIEVIEGIRKAMSKSKGWIGVDFDGTLAHYDGWQGETVFGEPIPAMVERVKRWLAEGYEVRIVTARVSKQEGVDTATVFFALNEWAIKHIGVSLPIVDNKDFGMIELWDDRVIQVVQNTGEPVAGQVSRTEGPPKQTHMDGCGLPSNHGGECYAVVTRMMGV